LGRSCKGAKHPRKGEVAREWLESGSPAEVALRFANCEPADWRLTFSCSPHLHFRWPASRRLYMQCTSRSALHPLRDKSPKVPRARLLAVGGTFYSHDGEKAGAMAGKNLAAFLSCAVEAGRHGTVSLHLLYPCLTEHWQSVAHAASSCLCSHEPHPNEAPFPVRHAIVHLETRSLGHTQGPLRTIR
jgi:hypothetical protein